MHVTSKVRGKENASEHVKGMLSSKISDSVSHPRRGLMH